MPYEVRPLPSKSYKFKQSEYDDVPALNATILITAPSNSGKSVLLQNLYVSVSIGSCEFPAHAKTLGTAGNSQEPIEPET